MEEKKIKRTPLYQFHIEHNAKMINFAGYEMPLQYEGIIKESLHTRRSVSIFDVSHMGEIYVGGSDALSFLSFISSNDPSKLTYGKVQYSILLTEKGTCVDDLLIYKLEDKYLCVVNAVNRFKDLGYMIEMSKSFKDVYIEDKSDEIFQVAIQGPRSQPFMEEFFDRSFSGVKYYTFIELDYMGNRLIVSRTGYTGEDGFEIYGDKKIALDFMNDLFRRGSKFNLKLAGLGARDILRLEMGYPLYGNELTEEVTPVEAGLEKFVKIDKEKILGKEVLSEQLGGKIEKKLIGLASDEKRAIPRTGVEVFYKNEKIGYVTSGGYSYLLDKSIALAYVKYEYLKLDSFTLKIREKEIEYKKETLPFIKNTSLRK
ncbi:MAG: glycine cleavage system aminomethyltransferase GcvT [Candidatus Hydrothermales bacterium]